LRGRFGAPSKYGDFSIVNNKRGLRKTRRKIAKITMNRFNQNFINYSNEDT
jgi:hypothetical protein